MTIDPSIRKMSLSRADNALVDAIRDLVEEVGDDDNELYVATAALVISVIALVATGLQVAQQYYASAIGYANCNSKVIGRWSKSKLRVLRPYEFRFEVQYDAPVIFLCRPDNENGPVKDKPLIMLDGSPKSCEDSLVELEEEDSNMSGREKRRREKDRVHTADNELASWVLLLGAIQDMEKKSRKWQDSRLQPEEPPRPSDSGESLKTDGQKGIESKHTLVVALQKKRKSWDTMPASVNKPYATTTWCHIIEIAAVLGIYWVEFDRSRDRYRAEGNGFMLSGEKVTDLGIMFTFQIYGKSQFGGNRIIPAEEVKDLSFGVVPTIYRRPGKVDARRLGVEDDRQDLSLLSWANRSEIAETLGIIGCNTNTVNYFARDDLPHCRVSHLFPLPFEIIAMLARTFHIDGGAFRLLPNPTIYRWNMKNYSMKKILQAYLYQIAKRHDFVDKDSPVMQAIRWYGEQVKHLLEESHGGRSTTALLDSLHQALDATDEVLTGKKEEDRPHRPRQASTLGVGVLSRPAAPQTKTQAKAPAGKPNSNSNSTQPPKTQAPNTDETEGERVRRQKVQDVLRSHIQEVLSALNGRTDKEIPEPLSAGGKPNFPSPSSWPFEAIDSAAPEDRPGKLMEIYFKEIGPLVNKQARASTKRRAPEPHSAQEAPAQGIRKRPTDKSLVGDAERGTILVEVDQLVELCTLPTDAISHEDIWCTLVFRMICWLMLHEFNPKDVQIPKSELRGSRFPVYIG